MRWIYSRFKKDPSTVIHSFVDNKEKMVDKLKNCEKTRKRRVSVKKIYRYAVFQGVIIFFIVGMLTYVFRGDFFSLLIPYFWDSSGGAKIWNSEFNESIPTDPL
ncbi:hypothetical protein [Streptococcus lactarius]|uniref:hypothetical protein n=1 Tax=Streptococcus lactarius TaxID=684066 RepID=UPI003607BCC9